MTADQQAAFILAQTALLNAEIAGMTAENQARQQHGLSLAYTGDAFDELYIKYEPVLGANAIVRFFAE